MKAIKGVYQNGTIELEEKPVTKDPLEVLVIFPEPRKRIAKLRGAFKGQSIDYRAIEGELKNLNRISQAHIITKAENL